MDTFSQPASLINSQGLNDSTSEGDLGRSSAVLESFVSRPSPSQMHSLWLDLEVPREPSLLLASSTNLNEKIQGKKQRVVGTKGNDTLDASKGKGKNTLVGKKGNDRLFGRKQDKLIGGAGDDRLDTRKGSKNTLKGGGGDDTFFVGKKDTASGGGGADTLDASKGKGRNTLKGGGGDDTLIGKMGDRLIGGGGADDFVLVKGKLPKQPLVVQDFRQGSDRLVIQNFSDASVFSDLSLTQQNGDTLLSIRGESVAILENVTATQLTSSDFEGISPSPLVSPISPTPPSPSPNPAPSPNPTPPSTLPQTSVDDAAVFEGNPGDNQQVSFVVRLSQVAEQSVTVTYKTVDIANGATANTDYVTTQGTLVIPPGLTSRLIDVPVIEDLDDESDERFELQLLSANGADIIDGTAIATIKDDEDEVVSSRQSSKYSSTSFDDSTVYSQFDVVQTTPTGTPIVDSYADTSPQPEQNGLFIGAIQNYQSGESEFRVPKTFEPDGVTTLAIANLEAQLVYDALQSRDEIEYRIVPQGESEAELIQRVNAATLTDAEQVLAVNSLAYIVENGLLNGVGGVIKRGDDSIVGVENGFPLGGVRDAKKSSYYSTVRVDADGNSSLIEEFTLVARNVTEFFGPLLDESPSPNTGTFIGAIEDYMGPTGSFSEGNLSTSLVGNMATYTIAGSGVSISGSIDLGSNGFDSDAAINDIDYILDNDLLKLALSS